MSASLILGAPSVLTAMVHSLVRDAVSLASTPTDIGVLDRHDDASIIDEQSKDGHRIFFSNFPSPSLIAKIASGGISTIALIDEPADSVRFMMAQSGWNFNEVLQAQTLAHTANRALYNNANVQVIYRGSDSSASGLINSIIEMAGVELAPSTVEELRNKFTLGGSIHSLEEMLKANVKDWIALDETSELFHDNQLEIVHKILDPMIEMAFEPSPHPLVIPKDLFKYGDNPEEAPPTVMELTGGMRDLQFGPYLYLPPGKYKVTFILGFSEDTKGMPFVMKVTQFFGKSNVAMARLYSPGAGIFEGSFEMNHEISNEMIEIVLLNEEGAIEGKIAVAQVSVELAP